MNKTLQRIASLAFGVGLSLSLGTTPAATYAATLHAPLSYSVSGALRSVSSPKDYQGPGVGWINNNNVPLVLNAVRYYVATGSYRLHAAPGQYVASIELAANSITGTQLIEVGVPTAASRSRVPHNGASTTSSIGPVTGPSRTSPDPSTSGYYEVVWHDPIDASLTIVKDNISWSYDGTYVDSYSGSDYVWWYSNDGWFQYGHSIGSYFNNNYTLSPGI